MYAYFYLLLYLMGMIAFFEKVGLPAAKESWDQFEAKYEHEPDWSERCDKLRWAAIFIVTGLTLAWLPFLLAILCVFPWRR